MKHSHRQAIALRAALLATPALLFAPPASAQDAPGVVRIRATPDPRLDYPSIPRGPIARTLGPGMRPVILLTGYWPPTNEGVRRFSMNPAQNPLGWIGQNWENRGYDVVSYFPEFSPPTCTSCGAGTGDLMVDYQDTTADFASITALHHPIAIITFSRGNTGTSWEVERNAYNYATWVNDYIAPLQPTPSPPDGTVPPGTLRISTLPMQEIVDNVLDSNLNVNPFICITLNSGNFLSGFIAYLGEWYQSQHALPSDPQWCVAAGHVHVGTAVPWTSTQRAVEVTLRTLIHHIDAALDPSCQTVDLYCATSTNSVGAGAMLTTSGSLSISANNLRLLVTGATPNQFGLVLYSAGSASIPWGNGRRCLASPFQRLYPVTTTDGNGFLDRALDFTLPPLASGPYAVLPGSTWCFQYAFRDVAAGGAGFNATNGARLTFCL